MSEFMDILSKFLQAILVAVLTAVTPVLVLAISRWIKAKVADIGGQLDEDEKRYIAWAVQTAVLAAEQSGLKGILTEMGKTKLQYATQVAKTFLARYCITLDLDELMALIQAEVIKQFPDDAGPQEAY